MRRSRGTIANLFFVASTNNETRSSEAKITAMDRLGMTVTAKLEVGGGGVSKVRIPYPRPVTERKAIKEVLVSVTSWTGFRMCDCIAGRNDECFETVGGERREWAVCLAVAHTVGLTVIDCIPLCTLHRFSVSPTV